MYVGRPTKWGNPFMIDPDAPEFWTAARCTALYRKGLLNGDLRLDLTELRGKNLSCWCAIGSPCHADVLLELANPPVSNTVPLDNHSPRMVTS